MKTFGKLVLAAAVVLPTVFTGCKKGENDPFLSLRSRKARVAGEWKVSKGEGKDTETEPFFNTTNTTTWTYDGAVKSNSTTNSAGGTAVTSTENRTMEYTFEKDGTFNSVEVVTQSNGDSKTTTIDGTWNFTEGVGEVKSKSQIIITPNKIQVADFDKSSNITTNSTVEYTGSEATMWSTIWDLDRLANKEMVVKWSGTKSSPSSTTEGQYTLIPR